MKALVNFLNLIKFEHSVFALPVALSGAMLASVHGLPNLSTTAWIVVACIGARSFAMSINRVIDKDIDFKNPRTKAREIPSGVISINQAIVFSIASVVVFFYAAWQLPKICLLLFPVALFWFYVYPFTIRFTLLSHIWLGIALGASPLAGWISVTGKIDSVIPFILGIAVVFWVSGFDIIYACQDYDFDKKNNLHSIPTKFGIKNALFISRIFHVTTIALLILLGTLIQTSLVYWFCVIFVAGMLFYEQSLVKPNDLSKVNLAFFTLNGLISVGFFIFILIEKIF